MAVQRRPGSRLGLLLGAACLLAARHWAAQAQMMGSGMMPLMLDYEEAQDKPQCQGQTPARVVVSKVVSYPAGDDTALIVLRNAGGQTANLTGWRLTDTDTRTVDAAMNYVFGREEECRQENYTRIEPGRALTLAPKSEDNPCGFEFGISFRDEVNLFNAADELVASAKWQNSEYGGALHLAPNGSYVQLGEVQTVVELLEQMGAEYSTFLEALKASGMAEQLRAASDPNYAGPEPPPAPPQPIIAPQFPWWFGYSVDRRTLPPPPPPPERPPPPPAEVPQQGPYTILAPTNEAFDALLRNLGGGRRLPREQLLQLPELKSILRYHILPGAYDSAALYNNTPIYTAQGVDVVPFTDPCMTEGAIMLHDACVDKPTPDNYTCDEQVKFSKCYFPFMTSALAAQWQGGFCQRTCERCSCAADSGYNCATVQQPDVKASNGLVHGITRVMFPPPVFNKTMYETMMNETEITALVPGLEPAGDAAAEAALPIPGVTAEGAVQEEAPADAAAAAPEDAAPADGAAAAEPEVVAQGLLFGKFIG